MTTAFALVSTTHAEALRQQVLAVCGSFSLVERAVAVDVELLGQGVAFATHAVVVLTRPGDAGVLFLFADHAVTVGVQLLNDVWWQMMSAAFTKAAAQQASLLAVEQIDELTQVGGGDRSGLEAFGGNLLYE